MKICTLIQYCTYDYQFIKKSINSVKSFSDNVIITYSNFFYDGSSESKDLLNKTFDENPDVDWVNIDEYVLNKKYNPTQLHAISRIAAFNKLKTDIDYILFIDSDEIIESSLFVDFINSNEFCKETDYKLSNYWYFREPIYRAKQLEDSILFAKKITMNFNDINGDREHFFINSSNVKKIRNYKYLNQYVLAHHYSWCKSKENMYKKINTWGHSNDRNWTSLLDEEYSRKFNGKDFVHGYDFEILSQNLI